MVKIFKKNPFTKEVLIKFFAKIISFLILIWLFGEVFGYSGDAALIVSACLMLYGEMRSHMKRTNRLLKRINEKCQQE